ARWRPRLQILLQEVGAALSPHMNVGEIVTEGLRAQGVARGERQRRAASLLEEVGLSPEDAPCRPWELSGGQRQRVGIARLLALAPAMVVAAEPLSSLDASSQAQILHLFQSLRKARGLACMFISHDVRAVAALADRTAVMKDGAIVELEATRTLVERPS